MGCAPGAGCCDECGGHGKMGATHHNVGATVHQGYRGRMLHGALGDTTCDTAGNCYDVTSSVSYGGDLMTGPPVNLNNPALQMGSADSQSKISATTYILGAIALIGLIEILKGRK